MKIVITGGHLTPALAVIEELRKREINQNKKWEIFFVGRKYAYEGEKTISQEYRVINAKNIPFLELNTGKIVRYFSISAVKSWLKIPLGFLKAFSIVLKIRPRLIFSFGGYLALPISFAGWILHIPIITHEQTFSPGLANKIISRFARKICLSYPDESRFFPSDKVVITGNPLREVIFQNSPPECVNIPEHEKIILVMGGNLGSHVINEVIKNLLPDLLEKYTIIHQIGESAKYEDYLSLIGIKEKLPYSKAARYYPFKYINERDIGWILNHTTVFIGRSGANTVAELTALSIPAILIPLPFAGENEQKINATKLEEWGSALVIDQKILTPDVLWINIRKIMDNYFSFKENVLKNKNKINLEAAKLIVNEIEKTLL